MIPSRFISRFTITLIFALLLITIQNCSNEIIEPDPDPGGKNDTTGPGSDLTPPQSITDLSMNYSLDDRAAYLEWTAPSDDSLDEAVSRYVIKFTYTDPFIWDLAIPASNPPIPSAPGELEQYAIRYPLRGRNLYSAMLSVDEAGNNSAISAVAMVHIPGYSVSGQCLNIVDRQPIEDLDVRLATGGIHQFNTDSDGLYAKHDLHAGAAAITISTGSAGFPCHTLQQNFELIGDVHRVEFIIPFWLMEFPRFENFLTFFKVLTGCTSSHLSTVLKTWKQRPVKCFIPAFVNTRGVDYEFEARRAAQRWMDRSGIALFTFVDQPPDTGITMHFKTRREMGIHVGITRHTLGDDGHPLRDDIDIMNDFGSAEDVYRITMHEIGHTIRFGYLPHREFIMYGEGNLPADISNDEAEAVKLLVSLPSRINMAIYDESTP
jgi:hypothetical protein